MHNKIIPIPSLKEQVYNYLKEAIFTNELQAGVFYSVQGLSDQLGVSRTPVREAVQQLQHEGIIDVFPYKGFTIKRISREEIDEVFEVREAIECFCIRKILSHYGSRAFENLMEELGKIVEEQRLQSLAKPDEPSEYWRLDKAFHRLMVDYSNNKTLKQVYESISDKISSIALATLKDRDRFRTASEEHNSILCYLKTGSPEAITKAAIHLANTKKLVLITLEQRTKRDI